METIRFDRKLLMKNHYPEIQKYLERVLTIAQNHDAHDNAWTKKWSKFAISFEDLTKH